MLIDELADALERRIATEGRWRELDREYQFAEAGVILRNPPATDQTTRARVKRAVWEDQECERLYAERAQAWRDWQEAERVVEILRDRISATRLRLQGRNE